MGFKEDAVFARYLSMGVYAADAVTKDLEGRHGHSVIELERYAKANKVWQTKVKRMRLPDLMCISCGRRIESKGKSKLEVKLSDSDAEGRAWRDGGMRLDDIFAFAKVDMTADPVTVPSIVYVTRHSLEEALASSKEGNRKAINEGSEMDRSWPMWAPDYAGVVLGVEISDERRTVHVVGDDGKKRRPYWHGSKWNTFYSLQEGDAFSAWQPVASSFAILESPTCEGPSWDWRKDLSVNDDDVRFPAVKAARFLDPENARDELLRIAEDPRNDWRVRLEAYTSLAPAFPDLIKHIREFVAGGGASSETQMEAVFALSELDSEVAVDELNRIATAYETLPEEVRAAAAWGLGTGARPSPDLLLDLIDDVNILVATHAAAVLPYDLSSSAIEVLVERLTKADLRAAATSAHLLAERDRIAPLVEALQAAPAANRRLIVLALGDRPRSVVEESLGKMDFGTRSSVLALWARADDWLRQPETEGALRALQQQMLRR